MFPRPNPFVTKERPPPQPQPEKPVRQQPVPHALGTQSLGYTLVQLRPHPNLYTVAPDTRDNTTAEAPASLSRWLFVYIPIVLLVIAVAYVMGELVMKHLAMCSAQQQLAALPDPEVLSMPPARKPAPPAAPKEIAVQPGTQKSYPMDLHSYGGASSASLF